MTVSITTTGGNLLGVVTGTYNAATGAPARTGESNNNAVADFADAGPDHMRGDYMMNIGGNSNSVTGSGSANGTACCVTEFSGRATTGALGGVNHATSATTTVQPGSVTPTSGSDMMSGCADNGNTSNGSPADTISATWTVDETGGAGTVWDRNGSVAGSAHKDNVSSAENPTWTGQASGVSAMAALIMEFLAAGGGPTETYPAGYEPLSRIINSPHLRM